MMVACMEWNEAGARFVGYQRMDKVMANLRKLEAEARKLLNETGCKHVVYGRKIYDESGSVKEVRYYMVPMDDERFEEVSKLRNSMVFAVHKL